MNVNKEKEWPQMFKITQFLKHHDNSHWAKSTSLLLLRTVQKEFWSVYLKVLEGNIIQQDSNRLDKKALKNVSAKAHSKFQFTWKYFGIEALIQGDE